jgi:hypothetical protein
MPLKNLPVKNRYRTFGRMVLGATFGVVLVLSGGIAAAYAADDDDSMLPDEKFVRSFLRSLGLRNGQEVGINYKERPPLVVPPSRDLPPPVTTTGSLTANNPAWPSDPDEKRKAAERKAKATRKPYNPETDQNQLPPDQLAQRSSGPAVKTSDGPDHSPEMTPSQLGYVGGLWKSVTGTFSTSKEMETAKFVREPSRNSLTDPPSGYRTPSPDQPYGINAAKERQKAQAPNDAQTDTVNK